MNTVEAIKELGLSLVGSSYAQSELCTDAEAILNLANEISTKGLAASIMPSYVDDVIEAYPRTGADALSKTWLSTISASGAALTPEKGKIYVLVADAAATYLTNDQFRWTGTAYVKIN